MQLQAGEDRRVFLERARAAHEVAKKGMLEAMAWEAIEPEISALYEQHLTDAEIDAAITNICRCGVYPRLVRAIERAGRVARRRERISAAPAPGPLIRIKAMAQGGAPLDRAKIVSLT